MKLLTGLLALATEVAEILPTSMEKKKKKFYKVYKEYLDERKKPWDQRDDAKLADLGDELYAIIRSFGTSLRGKGSTPVSSERD